MVGQVEVEGASISWAGGTISVWANEFAEATKTANTTKRNGSMRLQIIEPYSLLIAKVADGM
jgi:hypothetical protein